MCSYVIFLCISITEWFHEGFSAKEETRWGAWVAQSVKHQTSAQITISRLVGLSPVPGSMLTAQSLEPALDSVCLSLYFSPAHALFLSLKNK